MRIPLVLILLLSVSLACEGQISQYVPAVVGSDGGLVNVTVKLAPGDGDVYVNVQPRIGMMTQESVEDAVSYAYSASGKGEACDVFVTFEAQPTTTFIEGPSAGTALAVMTYALFENESMRGDTIMTGSIDRSGNVGPVGGLYEKAKGAANMGARYFITPVETFYETLLLEEVEEQYGITILEARKVDEVIAFMIEGKEIEQEPLVARKRKIPSLPPYDYSGMEAFESIARSVITLEEGVLGMVDESSTETTEIKDFFRNEVQRQEGILEDGYLFSAANEAFLNYIDISTINIIISGDVDLPRKKGDIGKCLTGISRPAVTDENFEWVVGADLRQAWAYDRLESTDIEGGLLIEEKFVKYNELMYGDAWCKVADELLSAAPEGGEELDESFWKQLAEFRLAQARVIGTTSDETLSRLSIAEKSYARGLYGAAIYDAMYVIKTEEARSELSEGVLSEEEVPRMLNETRSSLWGRIYHSHAAFLHQMNESDTAYRILRLAEGLDEATDDMVAESQPAQDVQGIKEEPNTQGCSYLYTTTVVLSTFLFVLVLIIIGRMIGHGHKRNFNSYRRKPSKGRARGR
jgi:hypothetical protein